jgi:hypothetical protein
MAARHMAHKRRGSRRLLFGLGAERGCHGRVEGAVSMVYPTEK